MSICTIYHKDDKICGNSWSKNQKAHLRKKTAQHNKKKLPKYSEDIMKINVLKCLL